MSRPLTMAETAAEVGLSYERFRKVWRVLCSDQLFPAPFRDRVWDGDAVEAWKRERSLRTFRPTEERRPGQPRDRLRQQRDALDMLRRAGNG